MASRAQSITPRLLSMRQAGLYMSVSYWSVRSMVESGRLKAVRLGPKMIRVEKAALDAMIEAHRDD